MLHAGLKVAKTDRGAYGDNTVIYAYNISSKTSNQLKYILRRPLFRVSSEVSRTETLCTTCTTLIASYGIKRETITGYLRRYCNTTSARNKIAANNTSNILKTISYRI